MSNTAVPPSKARASRIRPAPPRGRSFLYVRITHTLTLTSRMGHGAVPCWPDIAGEFPDRARAVAMVARLPMLLPLGQLAVAQMNRKRALLGIDLDHVAVAQQPDRAAHRCFRTDVTDAETPRCTRKPAIGDQRHLVSHALAVKGSRGGQHLAHPGTAARSLVADHQDLAFLIAPLGDSLKTGLLAVEAAGRPGEFQILHAGDLHDRPVRREIALEPHHAAGRAERPVGRMHHILLVVPRDAAE